MSTGRSIRAGAESLSDVIVRLAADDRPDREQAMPRDGLMILSDIRGPTLAIVCEPCGRRWRYRLERLIAEHGADAKLTDLLATLANCEKARSLSVHDRCKTKCEGL